MQIIVPPASPRSSATGEMEMDDCNDDYEPGSMECSIAAQLQHPNVVMTYKHAQVGLPNQVWYLF